MVCVDDNFEEEEAEERLLSLIRRQEWQTIVERTEDFVPIIRAPLLTTVQGGYNAKTSVLHLTCEQNPTYEVVDTLVSACPGAVTWRMNPGGQLPLHLATTWKASLSVIGFLLAANPLSARQVDCLGNLPLHCACFSGASEEIIESLLCTNPNGVNKRNKQGSTPQDIVRRLSHRNKKSVLSLFERVSLELLKHKRRSTMNHVQDSVDIRNGTNAETMQMKKKSRGGKNEKAKTVKATQIVNVNIKTQTPAENDDVLWV
jgi:ankyrin repeat protein